MACFDCGLEAEREVQFRYGRVRYLRYVVGSKVQWGEPQVGSPDDAGAVVQAWPKRGCASCEATADMAILIRASYIVGVVPWEGRDQINFGHYPLYHYLDDK